MMLRMIDLAEVASLWWQIGVADLEDRSQAQVQRTVSSRANHGPTLESSHALWPRSWPASHRSWYSQRASVHEACLGNVLGNVDAVPIGQEVLNLRVILFYFLACFSPFDGLLRGRSRLSEPDGGQVKNKSVFAWLYDSLTFYSFYL